MTLSYPPVYIGGDPLIPTGVQGHIPPNPRVYKGISLLTHGCREVSPWVYLRVLRSVTLGIPPGVDSPLGVPPGVDSPLGVPQTVYPAVGVPQTVYPAVGVPLLSGRAYSPVYTFRRGSREPLRPVSLLASS